MFVQAGIRPHGRWLGIFALTLPARGEPGKRYEPVWCELYRFQCGDCAWIPSHRRWIAWPHQVCFINAGQFYLGHIPQLPWQEQLVCNLETREVRVL